MNKVSFGIGQVSFETPPFAFLSEPEEDKRSDVEVLTRAKQRRKHFIHPTITTHTMAPGMNPLNRLYCKEEDIGCYVVTNYSGSQIIR